MEVALPAHTMKNKEQKNSNFSPHHYTAKPNQVGTVLLYGIPIVSLVIDAQERLCLAQISNTLLKQFSYNEIHNRRVALGITCVQCTPVQLEILRRAGAMPVSSRRCGMITRREAERLCKSFLGDNAPPRLPDDFAFSVHHECAWGCRGAFLPSRYNSSRAKCIKCTLCGLFFSPNKFIFHSHRTGPGDKYVQPDAANFNSWRRHMKLSGNPPDEITHAWEDVKAMFNGGTRKRLMASSSVPSERRTSSATPPKQLKMNSESPTPAPTVLPFPVSSSSPVLTAPTPRVPPPFPEISLPLSRSLVMDYVWHQSQAAKQHHQFSPFAPYTLPWLKRGSPLFFGHNAAESPLISFHRNAAAIQEAKPIFHQSAFRPVQAGVVASLAVGGRGREDLSDDETVDIETTEDEEVNMRAAANISTGAWNSPPRAEADRSIPGESLDRSMTPSSPRSTTAIQSSPSPVLLKIESDAASPQPLMALPLHPLRLPLESYEDPIPIDATIDQYEGRQFRQHAFSDSIDFRERSSKCYDRQLDERNIYEKEQEIRSFNDRVYDKGFRIVSDNERVDKSAYKERKSNEGLMKEREHGREDSQRGSLEFSAHRDALWRLSMERQERGPEFYVPDMTKTYLDARDKEHILEPRGSPRSTQSKSQDCSSCPACRPAAPALHSEEKKIPAP